MTKHIENPYTLLIRGDFEEITRVLGESRMKEVFHNDDRHVDYCVRLGDAYTTAELNKTEEGYALSFDRDTMTILCPTAGHPIPSVVGHYVSELERELRKHFEVVS